MQLFFVDTTVVSTSSGLMFVTTRNIVVECDRIHYTLSLTRNTDIWAISNNLTECEPMTKKLPVVFYIIAGNINY